MMSVPKRYAKNMKTIDRLLSLDPMEDHKGEPHDEIHNLVMALYKELKTENIADYLYDYAPKDYPVENLICILDCAAWCGSENGTSDQRAIQKWLDSDDNRKITIALYNEVLPFIKEEDMYNKFTELVKRQPQFLDRCNEMIQYRSKGKSQLLTIH